MDIQIDTSTIIIETERLILRSFAESDLADFYAYASVHGVGEMAGWPHHESIETSKKIMQMFIDEKNVFAIYHKADKKVIGSLGLHVSWANEDEQYKQLKVKEIGYVLSKDYWGQGLIPEAVKAVIDYGFNTLKLEAFTCGHFCENNQSRRVIEKCGLTFVKQSEFYSKQLQRSFEDMKYILLKEIQETNPIANYYNNYDENGRLEANHGMVEFLTTMRFIEKYLTPGAKVIEIGAGTGRYSRAIADKGYEIEAVELIPHNIEIFKANLKPEQKIRISQGNALDLSEFSDNTFDIALLLGPMYHLYTENDKRTAMSEALRVTKPGGVVFAAYCVSDGSIVWSGFQRKVFDIADYIERGKINPETFDTFSVPEDIFELIRKEDVDRLMSGFDVERLHYVSTDLFTNYMRGTVDAMTDEEFALYMRYHFAVCERQDMVGITHHSLDIFRKGNNTDIICRPATQADIDLIIARFAEQGDNKPREIWENYLHEQENGERIVIIAMINEEIVGYVTLFPKVRDAVPYLESGIPEIKDFNVFERFRRRGVGTVLMDKIESIAVGIADTVCLGVGLHSGYGAAQRMYVKRGYIFDGSGVWNGSTTAKPYGMVENGDGLILYMSKKLR